MSGVDWVAAYNDLHYMLVLERAARTLGLSSELKALLLDLYGETKDHVTESPNAASPTGEPAWMPRLALGVVVGLC